MIIKIHKAGRSFKGVSRYLLHDAGANTADRVAWTHTLNLTHDHVDSAVDEMLWTFRSADALKRAAGVSTGGSKLDKPVKHFSLSWPQGETPAQDHMIETVQAYMAHMGWAQHQAVLVAHNDTRHAHIHVVMNVVSPIDGRAARSFRDWRHAEAFALAYERAHGQIHCEQRLKPREERDATPTRESWQRFKKSEIAFERAEVERLTKAPDYFARHDDKQMNSREWEVLKAHQRKQREQFFIEGKEAFRVVRKAAFRDVREEFRAQWGAYYAAARQGHDRASLAEMKVALLAAQNRALDERRKMASDQLREERDRDYEAILEQQRFDRAELGRRQGQGLRTFALFDVVYPAPELATPQPKQDNSGRWQAHETDPAKRAANEDMFDRSGQFVIDPHAPWTSDRLQPGVHRRGHETALPTPTTDSFGRELRETELIRGKSQRDDAPEADTPRDPIVEMTEAASEKMRVRKAREMNNEAAAKERASEAATPRASWNRRRSRGERD